MSFYVTDTTVSTSTSTRTRSRSSNMKPPRLTGTSSRIPLPSELRLCPSHQCHLSQIILFNYKGVLLTFSGEEAPGKKWGLRVKNGEIENVFTCFG